MLPGVARMSAMPVPRRYSTYSSARAVSTVPRQMRAIGAIRVWIPYVLTTKHVLKVIVDFANTFDPERGGEFLTGEWLGFPGADVTRARELRDALRSLAFANARAARTTRAPRR